jgi:hypothetical protein
MVSPAAMAYASIVASRVIGPLSARIALFKWLSRCAQCVRTHTRPSIAGRSVSRAATFIRTRESARSYVLSKK